MARFLCLLPIFLFFSCAPITNEEEMVCIQVKDQSGVVETFNDKTRIAKFQEIDYFAPQPYAQVLRIFQKNREDKSLSILTSYHPNGQIKQYLEGIDSVAKGPYLEWHSNGKQKIRATILGGSFDLSYAAQKCWLFDGTSEVWGEEGNLLANISYESGLLEGTSIYYYPSGVVEKKIPYHKNHIHGEFCCYYSSGSLERKTDYKEGKKQGTSIGYWENEQPSHLEEHEKDLLITGVYFCPKGNVISQIVEGNGSQAIWEDSLLKQKIEYQEGSPSGKVVSYTPSGDILSEYTQKNGKKQGTEIIFYPKKGKKEPLQKKLSITWDDDAIHGLVKTWYRSGELESQKEYYRNQKNGSSCAWYENGALMLLEEYEKDLLIKGSYYQVHTKKPASKVTLGSGEATIYDGSSFAFLRKIVYENGRPIELP